MVKWGEVFLRSSPVLAVVRFKFLITPIAIIEINCEVQTINFVVAVELVVFGCCHCLLQAQRTARADAGNASDFRA
jgi:hypothetical protein